MHAFLPTRFDQTCKMKECVWSILLAGQALLYTLFDVNAKLSEINATLSEINAKLSDINAESSEIKLAALRRRASKWGRALD